MTPRSRKPSEFGTMDIRPPKGLEDTDEIGTMDIRPPEDQEDGDETGTMDIKPAKKIEREDSGVREVETEPKTTLGPDELIKTEISVPEDNLDIAAKTDPETSTAAFVVGSDSSPDVAKQMLNGIINGVQRTRDTEQLDIGKQPVFTKLMELADTVIVRSRREAAELGLDSAVLHIPEGGIFAADEKLKEQGDTESSIELPASVAIRIISEEITPQEFEEDKNLVKDYEPYMTKSKAEILKDFEERKQEFEKLRKEYEEKKENIQDILKKASEELGVDDIIGHLRRERRERRGGYQYIKNKLLEMKSLTSKEVKALFVYYSKEVKFGIEGMKFSNEKARVEDAMNIINIIDELKQKKQTLEDNEYNQAYYAIKEDPRFKELDPDGRMVLQHGLVKNRLLARGTEFESPQEFALSSEDERVVDVLLNRMTEGKESVDDILQDDTFRNLSRIGKFVLSKKFIKQPGSTKEDQKRILLETRAIIAGRPGNEVQTFLKKKNGEVIPLHDEFSKKEETMKLRDLDREVRGFATSSLSKSVDAGDEIFVLPTMTEVDGKTVRAEDILEKKSLDEILQDKSYPVMRVQVPGLKEVPAEAAEVAS